MYSEHFMNNLPHIDKIRESGIRMLITIVNRADGEKAVKFLREQHFHFQFTCMAEGTQRSEILDMLGFGSIDKTIVFCVSPGFHVKSVMPELYDKLNMQKSGNGIAFTIPLSGVSLPLIQIDNNEHLERWRENMENEVYKMSGNTEHSMILALIDHGNSEELVKTARNVGATGATVIHARRTGTEDSIKFFGISVQAEKEIVAILTKRETKQQIMDAINESFGITSPAHGIILSLPVESVAGME